MFDKCRQLDSMATALLKDEEPLTGVPHGKRHARIVPALVVGGGIPLNPLVRTHIRECLQERGLLDHPLIEPLAILDLEDVELLEAAGERGMNPSDILVGWQASELSGLPLNNYMLREGTLVPPARPARMEETVSSTFEEVVSRLGLRPPADPEPED